MIIDCHYHLEERVFTKAELLKEMDGAGVEKIALMGSMIEPFREPPKFLLGILQKLPGKQTAERARKTPDIQFHPAG